MSIFDPQPFFRISEPFKAFMHHVGLDAESAFTDPRIKVWRKLEDRENATLDVTTPQGRVIRLHLKRYVATGGFKTTADIEVRGYRGLATERIPTAPLVAWGKLVDGRSVTIWLDLAGYSPADKLIEAGTSFDRLLQSTADLAAALHRGGLHHQDLYLCHFMVADPQVLEQPPDVKLIDVARVRRFGGLLTKKRWIVKDLAQFWYSTLKLPVTDEQRHAWLARYAEQRRDGTTPAKLLGAIQRKVAKIARHDKKLVAAQPTRNISIPTAAPGAVRIPAAGDRKETHPPHPCTIRPARPEDAERLIAYVNDLCSEPDLPIPMRPGEFKVTVEEERKLIEETAASDRSTFLLAEADGQIVGLLNCMADRPRQALRHITHLGLSVHRDWRGKGVGAALMQAAVDWARMTGVITRIELEVYCRNEAAIRLYQRFGFQIEGRKRNAIREGNRYEDGYVMALLL